MRAKTVNFERTLDPMRTMKIGSHRELTDQHLVDAVFDKIFYNDLETDPKFAKIDPLILNDDVYNWVLNVATVDPETEKVRTMSPDEITSDDYRNFYDEIHEPEVDEEDWEEDQEEDQEENDLNEGCNCTGNGPKKKTIKNY